MSLLIRFGVRSLFFSIVEVAVFLGLSVAYFMFLPRVYGPIAERLDLVSTTVPIWGWVLMGGLYLLIVTVYWSPGEKPSNDTELFAFVIVIAAALVVGAIYAETEYDILSNLGKEFVEILRTGGRAT